MKKIRFCPMFLLLLVAFPAMASEIQPLSSIRDTANSFIEAEVQMAEGEMVVHVGKLDRRLRLKKCSLPLEAYLPNGVALSGNTSVGVRCEGEKPWSILVQARIQKYLPVAVASRALGRNTRLTAGDFKMKKVDVTNLAGGYFESPDALQDMVMRRQVRSGTILTSSLVQPAILIKRGEKVIILAETGTIRVRMEGKALQNGTKGELIEVKNLSSQQVIEAIVVAPGQVQVRM